MYSRFVLITALLTTLQTSTEPKVIQFIPSSFHRYYANEMPEKKTYIFFVIAQPLEHLPELKYCYIAYDRQRGHVGILRPSKLSYGLYHDPILAIRDKLAQQFSVDKIPLDDYLIDEERGWVYKISPVPIKDFFYGVRRVFGENVRQIQVQGNSVEDNTFQIIRENLSAYPEIIFRDPD